MISRSQLSYAMFVSMALGSHQLNQEKLLHLRNMIIENEKGGVLASKSIEDETLAKELSAESKADAAEASTLEEEAKGLDILSKKDESLAEKEEIEAASLQAEAADATAQASKKTAEAVAEQSFVVEEREKAAVEALEAQGSTEVASADEIGVGLCEAIPFVNVLCDVIGGAVAIGEETAAAVRTSQSAIDYTIAHETEVQEEKDLATAGILRAKSEEFAAKAEETFAEAESEKAKAIEEKALATEKHTKAAAEVEQSEQEQILSEEKEAQSAEEKAKSAQLIKEALAEALHALIYSIWSLFLSFIALVFFSIRMLGTIIFPALGTVTQSVAAGLTTSHNERMNFMNVMLFHSSYRPLRRKIHYILLHLKVYVLTMFLTFDQFSMSDAKVTPKGEVILFFVLIAATTEATLLHFLPHVWKTRSNGNYICHVGKSIVFILARALIFLFVLFTLETIIISLLCGQLILIHKTSKSIQICQYILLVLFAISSAYWFVNETTKPFESKNTDEENAVEIIDAGESSSLLENNKKSISYIDPSDLIEIVIEEEEEEVDNTQTSKVSQDESLLQMKNLQYMFESAILIYMFMIILKSILPTIHLFMKLKK